MMDRLDPIKWIVQSGNDLFSPKKKSSYFLQQYGKHEPDGKFSTGNP